MNKVEEYHNGIPGEKQLKEDAPTLDQAGISRDGKLNESEKSFEPAKHHEEDKAKQSFIEVNSISNVDSKEITESEFLVHLNAQQSKENKQHLSAKEEIERSIPIFRNDLIPEKRNILSMERHLSIHKTENGIPLIQDTVIIQKQPSNQILFFFSFKLLVFAFVIQSLFYIWSKIHKQSSKIFCLILLYSFPLILPNFIILPWLFYLATIGCYLKFSRQPYILFSFFCSFLRILYVIIFISQLLLVIFFISGINIAVPFLLLLLSIYFAILTKESVMFLKRIVHLPKSIPKESCFICLRQCQKDSYTLKCDHSFHSNCIRGWILLGKRKHCPYCNAYVNSLNMSFTEEKFEHFSSILDYTKNLIIFVFFLVIYLKFE